MKAAKTLRALAAVLPVLLLSSCPVNADWDEGEPSRCAKLADLTATGLAVNGSGAGTLAASYLSMRSGPVTAVHMWGTWKDGAAPIQLDLYGNEILHMGFMVSIHGNLPAHAAGNPNDYDIPGPALWSWSYDGRFGEFGWRRYCEVGTGQGWYDPDSGDHQLSNDKWVYQFNFPILASPALMNAGTPAAPVRYWLLVDPQPPPPYTDLEFGWSTAETCAGAPALLSDGTLVAWEELAYPGGHDYSGQPLDLAFVIAPEPASLGLLSLGLLPLARRRWRR
jgi:hypothetical protein